MKTRFLRATTLALVALNVAALAAVADESTNPVNTAAESSINKESQEIHGNVRVVTLAGPVAEAIGRTLHNAGYLGRFGFVLPSQEGKDTSISVVNLMCSANPVTGINGTVFGCQFIPENNESPIPFGGQDAAVLFNILRKAAAVTEIDPMSRSATFGANSLKCGDQAVLNGSGQSRTAYVCQFVTRLM